MRPIFTIFALIFTLTLYSCGETIVDYNEDKEHIEELSDVVYYKGTPFSGTMIWNGKGEKTRGAISGQLERKATFKDGILVMVESYWYYENGQLKEKTTHKDGIPNGPYESYTYYENGQLEEKVTYKDEKPDGPYESGLQKKEGFRKV